MDWQVGPIMIGIMECVDAIHSILPSRYRFPFMHRHVPAKFRWLSTKLHSHMSRSHFRMTMMGHS